MVHTTLLFFNTLYVLFQIVYLLPIHNFDFIIYNIDQTS